MGLTPTTEDSALRHYKAGSAATLVGRAVKAGSYFGEAAGV